MTITMTTIRPNGYGYGYDHGRSTVGSVGPWAPNVFYTTGCAITPGALAREAKTAARRSPYEGRFLRSYIGRTFDDDRAVSARADAIRDRFRRFVTYMTETRHDWEHVKDIAYADNSLAVIERSSLTGERRERMTLGPGGDACF